MKHNESSSAVKVRIYFKVKTEVGK